MRQRSAALLLSIASASALIWGALAGLGGTANLIYLIVIGDWANVFWFLLIGAPVLGFIAWVGMMITSLPLVAVAGLLDRDAAAS